MHGPALECRAVRVHRSRRTLARSVGRGLPPLKRLFGLSLARRHVQTVGREHSTMHHDVQESHRLGQLARIPAVFQSLRLGRRRLRGARVGRPDGRQHGGPDPAVRGHRNAVNEVAYSPLADAVCSVDADGVAKVWDVRAPQTPLFTVQVRRQKAGARTAPTAAPLTRPARYWRSERGTATCSCTTPGLESSATRCRPTERRRGCRVRANGRVPRHGGRRHHPPGVDLSSRGVKAFRALLHRIIGSCSVLVRSSADHLGHVSTILITFFRRIQQVSSFRAVVHFPTEECWGGGVQRNASLTPPASYGASMIPGGSLQFRGSRRSGPSTFRPRTTSPRSQRCSKRCSGRRVPKADGEGAAPCRQGDVHRVPPDGRYFRRAARMEKAHTDFVDDYSMTMSMRALIEHGGDELVGGSSTEAKTCGPGRERRVPAHMRWVLESNWTSAMALPELAGTAATLRGDYRLRHASMNQVGWGVFVCEGVCWGGGGRGPAPAQSHYPPCSDPRVDGPGGA